MTQVPFQIGDSALIKGDSGGPLFHTEYMDGIRRSTQIGVAHGIVKDYPGVYVSIEECQSLSFIKEYAFGVKIYCPGTFTICIILILDVLVETNLKYPF